MSFEQGKLYKKEGDKCPACYSSDSKKLKGTLQRKSTSWGLHCTICKYSVMTNCSNSRRSRINRWRKKQQNQAIHN